jgi:hypothetical protein
MLGLIAIMHGFPAFTLGFFMQTIELLQLTQEE